MNAAGLVSRSRHLFTATSPVYKVISLKLLLPNATPSFTRLSSKLVTSTRGNLQIARSLHSSVGSKQALAYGCLASASWFAVYGLTGGMKNSKSPNVNVGFDHYPSNNPCEDRIFVETPIPGMLVAGVADGHGGTFVSDIIKMEIGGLVKKLFSDIQGISSDKLKEYLTEKTVRLYHDLDDLVYHMVMSMWEKNSSVITTGSCLVSTIIFNSNCVIANAGDCRAVLGRYANDSRRIEAVALTNDHNIREPEELKKLKEAHPKERDLVKYYDGEPVYVKGMLQPTRCIGDFILKSKEFLDSIPILNRLSQSFNPPYITSTPELTIFPITRNDEFIVMASDGVWDELNNDDVIGIVAESLKKGNSVENSANTVVEACLAHAAKRNELTLKQLKELHAGQRRRFHDDMSVIIILLHPKE